MDVKEKSPSVTTKTKSFLDNFLTCRRVLNIMVFLGFMVNYMLRVNLNFAIVDMILEQGASNDTSTTPFSLTAVINDPANLTRLTRSLPIAELTDAFPEPLAKGDDDEDDEESSYNRNFRKNNFVGTNGAAAKQSTATQNKPLAAGTSFQPAEGASGLKTGAGLQSFSSGSNFNPSNGLQSSSSQVKGFQSFGSGSAGNPAGGFQSFSSGSATNQGGGFQSFSSGSGTNQGGGFQSFNSGSGTNQGAGFQTFNAASASSNAANGFQSSSNNPTSYDSSQLQSSSQSGTKSQFNAAASEASELNGSSKSHNSNTPSSSTSDNTQQSNEPAVQPTNLKNEFQASPGIGQNDGSSVSNTLDQKVGLAPNSLADSTFAEENSNGSRILFTGGSNNILPEVANAKIDEQTQSSGSTVAPEGTKKSKKKRYQKPNVRRFSWSEAEQNLLIGSFFWGYICTELPGGRLAEVIGARKVFGYATLGASVVTLLTPMFAKINFILLLLIRISLGLFLVSISMHTYNLHVLPT